MVCLLSPSPPEIAFCLHSRTAPVSIWCLFKVRSTFGKAVLTGLNLLGERLTFKLKRSFWIDLLTDWPLMNWSHFITSVYKKYPGLFLLSSSFSHHNSITKRKAQILCLGFEPGPQAQTDPLSYVRPPSGLKAQMIKTATHRPRSGGQREIIGFIVHHGSIP